MYCENCGMNNADHVATCLRCGYPMIRPVRRERRPEKKASSSGMGALITVGIFMLLSAVLIILTFA